MYEFEALMTLHKISLVLILVFGRLKVVNFMADGAWYILS